MKWQGKLIVYCIGTFFAFFVLRAIVAHYKWDAQPAPVKAAATKLQQDLLTNAKVHDLLRFRDGHLAMIVVDQRNNELRIANCGSFDLIYPIDTQNLAEQIVARIPYSSPDYGDAAKECLSRY